MAFSPSVACVLAMLIPFRASRSRSHSISRYRPPVSRSASAARVPGAPRRMLSARVARRAEFRDVSPGDLQAHRRSDACCLHIHAPSDGHRPSVGDTAYIASARSISAPPVPLARCDRWLLGAVPASANRAPTPNTRSRGLATARVGEASRSFPAWRVGAWIAAVPRVRPCPAPCQLPATLQDSAGSLESNCWLGRPMAIPGRRARYI